MSKCNELPQASDCTYLINNHDASSLLLSFRVLILYQDTQRTSVWLCERCYAHQFGNAKFRSLVLSHRSVKTCKCEILNCLCADRKSLLSGTRREMHIRTPRHVRIYVPLDFHRGAYSLFH